MNLKSNFLSTLQARGFIQDCTDFEGLDAYFLECEKSGKPAIAYIGFDCTAKSLHVGSLMQIMILRWLQKLGHKPIALLGGGTTKIGDPSGKDETRKILSDDDIEANKQGIRRIFDKYIKFGSAAADAILVDNDEWLSGLKYIQFLRDVGRHFSVNRMLSMDSVKLRLEREQNLSFIEFNYMILQAYDFVELNKNYGCRLQIGGSDQWGNIVNGIDLYSRTCLNDNVVADLLSKGRDDNPFSRAELHSRMHWSYETKKAIVSDSKGDKTEIDISKHFIFGLTTPLLTTSSGAKMGKTASGAVWLSDDMLSTYDFWQYWRNTEDADVVKFLKLFTELSLKEIAELEKLQGADINKAKIILANEVTKLCHGLEAAKHAEETAKKVFEQGGVGEDLPEILIEKSQLDAGIPIAQLFTQAGLTASNGEAKKLIQGGGAKINDEKISDISMLVNSTHLKDGIIKLSAGKKKHAVVKVS
jgi:tyrosyl-tRNA synthetase